MSEQTPKTTGNGFDLNQPTIIALLYLSSFVVGITGIIGVILAFVWKGDGPEEWEVSHFEFHIRTFVIGLIASIVGGILMLVLIGFFILAATALWVIIRTIVAMLKAQNREALADPKTLWI